MWNVFTQLAINLGVSFETLILIIFLLGGGIFCAKSLQLGLMIYFLGSGCIFMWFYTAELNYTPIIIVFFMSLVCLALSIWASSQVAEKGGLV